MTGTDLGRLPPPRALLRHARWLPLLAVALVISPLLTGSSQAAGTGVVPGSDSAALALLAGAVQASASVSYRGVELVAAPDDGPGESVLDVSHDAGSGTVLVVRGSASVPATAGFQDEMVGRPDLLVRLLERSYRIVLDGTGSVAGRDARMVQAERPDGSVAARFWLDTQSGLLLRRDLVDRSGRVSASMRFSAVSLTEQSMDFLPPLVPSVGAASLGTRSAARWCEHGWPCPARIGDLTLFDARPEPAVGAQVVHLSYSDGLSTVSVFVQPGRLDPLSVAGASELVGGQRVLVRGTRPRELLWSAKGFVFTVVADAPDEVLSGAVADLPHTDRDPSGWSRVLRGLSRVGSWINPFR